MSVSLTVEANQGASWWQRGMQSSHEISWAQGLNRRIVEHGGTVTGHPGQKSRSPESIIPRCKEWRCLGLGLAPSPFGAEGRSSIDVEPSLV